MPLGRGVFGEKTHSSHPCESETAYYTSRKTKMRDQRKQSKKDLLPGYWLGYLTILFTLQIFWYMYVLWFRTLLFNAVLGAETRTSVFCKTFQSQTVGRKKST